jgi:hypothetical protein
MIDFNKILKIQKEALERIHQTLLEKEKIKKESIEEDYRKILRNLKRNAEEMCIEAASNGCHRLEIKLVGLCRLRATNEMGRNGWELDRKLSSPELLNLYDWCSETFPRVNYHKTPYASDEDFGCLDCHFE